MDFGGGFATGIAAGMGSGIAIGISTGQNQTRQQIRNHIEDQGITLQDRFGKPLKVDGFLDEACGSTACCERNRAAGWIALALGIAVAAAVLVYVLM